MTDSAQANVDIALSAIAARNSDLAIVTTLNAARAQREAIASDQRRAAGQLSGPLDGMILGIKDNLAVEGLPWTGGLGARRETLAKQDATVVARLSAAGAIPLAMLNMHEGALGATTDNPHFGRTANPLDPDRTPGGSSGGSGAAIPAGFGDITLGTDTMGSVRLPAAYCGVAGLKPTRGLIPRTGLIFLSPTFDTIGPLAQDVETLAAMAEVMAGQDQGDPASKPVPGGWRARPATALPAGLTIGIPKQIDDVACEDEVLQGLALARGALERAGAGVSDVDLRGWQPARARRGGLLVCEAEGAIALSAILDRPGSELMSDELRDLLSYGRNLSADRLADGHARIQAAADSATQGFADVDVLLMPTAPQRAFRHSDPVPANQADLTSLANFHGGPAVAVPVPGNGLPNSVQIVGPDYSEALVLTIGRVLETALAMRN